MSKYTKLIGITMFTIVSFCIYNFVQISAKSENNLTLETLEGDSAYADSFAFSGYLYDEIYTTIPSFYYVDGTFTLTNESSFLESTDASGYLTTDQLMKEHKSFMRGKSPYSLFHMDEEKVVYAASDTDEYWSASPNKLNLSILDKNTEEVSDYTFSLPEDSSGTSLQSVIDFYVQYPVVYFTVSTVDSVSNSSKFKVYSTDLTKENPELQFIRDMDPSLNAVDDFYAPDNTRLNSQYVGLIEENYTDDYDVNINNFTVYDYHTDTLLEIEDLKDLAQPSLLGGEEDQYITSSSENGFSLYHVDTSTDPATLSLVTELPSSDNNVFYPLFISDNLLYSYAEISDSKNMTFSIQINDLTTGEIVYKGKVTGKDSKPIDVSLVEIRKADN